MMNTGSIRNPGGKGEPARYVMIGGFLGAGKTTAVSRLAARLAGQGRRVGLITNDQGDGLVDTTLLRSRGFATEEIAGGCFCCRFNSLMEAAGRLTVATRPEVIIAEPVGSCTDLVATVTYPLRRIYGDAFTIAPLSVMVDPTRALRVLGLEPGAAFSEKVCYIYRKQLEEADWIVLNKSDSVEPARLGALRGALSREFPLARLFEVSARTGQGLDDWFDALEGATQGQRSPMEVDYDVYAEGEALLGWLNATVRHAVREPVDVDDLLGRLMGRLRDALAAAGAEVAHLKVTYSADGGLGGVAAMNQVRGDLVPELTQSLEELSASGELIVNLRAEADPDRLRGWVTEAVRGAGASGDGLELLHLESFKPGRPTPTHRMGSAG